MVSRLADISLACYWTCRGAVKQPQGVNGLIQLLKFMRSSPVL